MSISNGGQRSKNVNFMWWMIQKIVYKQKLKSNFLIFISSRMWEWLNIQFILRVAKDILSEICDKLIQIQFSSKNLQNWVKSSITRHIKSWWAVEKTLEKERAKISCLQKRIFAFKAVNNSVRLGKIWNFLFALFTVQ